MCKSLMSLIATAALCLGVPAAQAGDPAIAQLAWLGGCWANVGSEAGSGEQWMAPAGEVLLGMSRTIQGGRTVGYEFMRIASGPDGRLSFYAQPSGQPAASFAALRQTPQEIVFENLAHDFPQRIVYRLDAPDRLHARIEGLRRGQLRQVEFPMTRVACAAGP